LGSGNSTNFWICGTSSEKENKRNGGFTTGGKINLTDPEKTGGAPIWGVIDKRRSIRSFSSDKSLDLKKLSQLLWAAYGLTESSLGRGEQKKGGKFRAAPSAYGKYTIGVFVFVGKKRVRDGENCIKNGVYYYCPNDHSLTLVNKKSVEDILLCFPNEKHFVKDANIIVLLASDTEKINWLSDAEKELAEDKGHVYAYMDSGYISMNVCLAATALDLATVPIAKLIKERGNSLLKIDEAQKSNLESSEICGSKFELVIVLPVGFKDGVT